MIGPVLIIGGTGRIGGLVSERLLSSGASVRILGRSADPRRGGSGGPTFVRGDVRDRDLLPAGAFEGLAGLLFSVEPDTASSGPRSPEATMFAGVRNVVEACRAAGGTPHVVLISQIYVTRHDHPMNAYGHLLDWRLRGEDVLRSSGLPYTVVRPSWLTTDRADGHGVRLEQGDTGEGRVSRSDVADACFTVLTGPAALGTTFELFNEPGPAPDWPALLGRLAPDRASAAR